MGGLGGGNVPGRHTRSQMSNVTWQPTVVTVLEWSVGGEIIITILLLLIIIMIIIHLLYGRKAAVGEVTSYMSLQLHTHTYI